jgi:predicted  nucleic acid-binding Zn-ribbon protein
MCKHPAVSYHLKLINTDTEGRLDNSNKKLDNCDEKLDNLEKNMSEKFKDLDNKAITLLSDIKVINRKLDRQSAKLDIISSTVKEHEIRIEDLEGLKV